MEECQDLSDKEQFKRIKLLLKEENFRKLLNASVTIVGVGAVGGYVLEALARAGIGKITIIDHDIVSKSNINRQIVALNSTVGRKKVMVAKERVLDINPDCKITAVDMFVNKETVKSVFDLKSDIIIDAIDSLNPKFELLKMAIETETPIISSMGGT